MVFAEDLLHYVWKFRLYDNGKLCTEDGNLLRIISPGLHHHHAGPDFQ